MQQRQHLEARGRGDSGSSTPRDSIYTCNVCGNTIMGQPPAQCPECGAPGDEFRKAQ